MKKQKIEVGDLVQIGGIWKKRIGIVRALDDAWYMLKNHIDVSNCMVERKDVKIIKKQIVPKKYIKYLNI